MSCQTAFAAYTRVPASDPVHIQSIYSNEWGSPFLHFATSIGGHCNAMYLYDITASPANVELRKNKMAIAMSAKLAGKRVVLDYSYDLAVEGWGRCYINGIQLVD